MKKFVFQLLILVTFIGCLPDKSNLHITMSKKRATVSSSVTTASVSSVQVINNQLVINGHGFMDVANVKVSAQSFTEIFSIESKTATKIIANSIRAFSFDVSKVFSLILSDANASATFAIDFSLCNATLNGKGFSCATAVADKDVLSYDAVSGTWKPRAVSGLNYLGAFNASANPAAGPATQPAGAYYIISASGTIAGTPFTTGDWLVSNGSSWQKIDNSTSVLSVFGRTGSVSAQSGDYNLDMLGDISFPTAPVAGKVLKFDGTNWIAGDDISGGGAGSVTSTEILDGAVTDAKITSVATSKLTGTISSAQIADGTIMNADINAAALIDYSKLNVPDGAIPAVKISGLPVLSTILAASITDDDSTHAPTGDAVYEALLTKIGTGGGTLSVGTISGIPTPVNPSDVSNKAYVNSEDALRLLKAGDTMSGVLTLDNDLRVKGGANYVTIKGSAASTTYDLTLPANKGTSGYVLATDGNGVTSWVDVNSAIASLDTDDVAEGTRLYFTEARVLGTDLAGLNTGVNGPITAADTVLGAFGKMQYQVTDLKSKGLWDKTVNDIAYTAGNVSIDKKLRLKSDNANYVEILSPTSLTSTYTLTLPANDGNANQILKTDGAGVLSWVDDISGPAAFSGTANRAVITTAGGALDVSTTTSAELGHLIGVTSPIQTQISNKQAADATLTALAAYNTNGILVQTAADTFTGRTITGTATRLTVTDGNGFAGNPTLNVSPTLLPSPVVGDVGKYLKATAADTSVWTALSALDVTTALTFTPVNKAGDSITAGNFIFSGTSVLRANNPVAATDVVNKQYLETFGQWTKSGSDIYFSNKVGVGTSTPQSALDVNGSVRVGVDAAACTVTNAGAMKFNTPNVEFCNGSAWASFAVSNAAVASAQITDGTITNADVNAAANITATKLGTGVVDDTEFNYLNGVTSSIQTQINGKQATDATLTSLAAYNTDGILVQTAADTFTGRSIAGTANRVTVTDGNGVAGNPTLNISTSLLPSPTGVDAGKFLKATAADTSAWTALASSDVTTALGFTPINKAGDSIASGTFDFNGGAVIRTLNPVFGTDVANKQYVDSYGQWIKNVNDISYSLGNVGIGTTTPGTYALSVYKAANATFNMESGGNGNAIYNRYAGKKNNGVAQVWGTALNLSVGNGEYEIYDFTNSASRLLVDTTGRVGIGTITPSNKLSVSPFQYSTGNASQSGTTVTGVGTTWTSAMVGSQFVFANGTSAGTVTNFGNTTSLTVSVSQTVTTQGYIISYTGLQVNSSGNIGIGTTTPAAKLSVEGGGAVGFQMKTTAAIAADTMNFINDMTALGNFWFAKGTTSSAAPAVADRLMNLTNNGNLEIYGQQVTTADDYSGVLSLKTESSATGGTRNEVSMEFYADGTDLDTKSGFVGYESNLDFDLSLKNHKAGKLILGTSNADNITILSDGKVGIGISAPTYGLHVNGSVAGTGAYNSLSDQRLKKDVVNIPYALNRIESIRGVSFNWKKEEHPELKLGDRAELGVIAQEVQKIFPEAVTKDKNTGILSVAYSMLIAPIIEAIKELSNMNKIHERKIASLVEENKNLKVKNDQMASYLCKKDPNAPFCK